MQRLRMMYGNRGWTMVEYLIGLSLVVGALLGMRNIYVNRMADIGDAITDEFNDMNVSGPGRINAMLNY